MAGLRQIAMRFTGDAKDLDTASDQAAKGLNRVGDSAENLDDKGSKATDSLGALSSGFELVGLGAFATGLQSAAMATDFLSGVGTGLNLIMELQSVQFVKAKVATIAHTVAQKASAAASKAWAAVQWILNAALTANPIGLVIAAIAGLVAIIIIAWKRSDTFRTVVTAAFTAVTTAAGALVGFFQNKLWPGIKWVWDKITSGASAVKNGIVGGFNSVVSFVQNLPGRISSAAGGMFNGVRDAFRSAINWIIGRWNDLHFTIPGVDTHIPGVGTIGGFTLNTPNIPMLASGGRALLGGMAVVGEAGPELVNLNAGATVTPLEQGGGDTYVIVEMDGRQFDARIKSVTREERREIRRGVTSGALRGAPA